MSAKRVGICAGLMVLQSLLAVGQASRPLTNNDVLNMVRSKLPESVIVQAIQSNPNKFDTSSSALIALHKAGVTEAEMKAMMASSSGATAGPLPSGPAGAAPAAANPTLAPSKSHMPRVAVVERGTSRDLPLEKTQLAETKTKPSSMAGLAGDTAVAQAMQAGINTAAMDTAMHMNSAIGGSTVQQAGSIFSGVMARRKPTVTYVWGVPSPSSGNVLQSGSPLFSVDFSRVIGANPDDYEPALVRLTPAQNTCRIVGATQAKEDVRSSPAADWEIYSHFLEERVAATPQKLGTGKYKIGPASELAPGEYAVVLRPIAKDKKFSGGDVARSQGDGLLFNAVWTFQVADQE